MACRQECDGNVGGCTRNLDLLQMIEQVRVFAAIFININWTITADPLIISSVLI